MEEEIREEIIKEPTITKAKWVLNQAYKKLPDPNIIKLNEIEVIQEFPLKNSNTAYFKIRFIREYLETKTERRYFWIYRSTNIL